MPASEVGLIRDPVRPLSTTNVSMAFPGELLVDPKTGGFIYVAPDGSHLTHRKPGKLTLRYGDDVLADGKDLSDDLDITIPKVEGSKPGNLTIKYGTNTLVDAKSMGTDIEVTIPEPKLDTSTLVPATRKVNGKALSEDISLSAADVSARPATWTPTAADVGARPSTWTPTAADVGAVPTTRKVNGKALSEDISLSAADVGARPSTWTPTAADVGALAANGKATSAATADTATKLATARAIALGGVLTGSANFDGSAGITITAAHKVVSNLSLTTTWTGSAAPYTQELAVSGLLATDVPTVDFRATGTYSTDKTAEEAWLNIYRIEVLAGKLKFHAHAKPTVAIPVQIKF